LLCCITEVQVSQEKHVNRYNFSKTQRQDEELTANRHTNRIKFLNDSSFTVGLLLSNLSQSFLSLLALASADLAAFLAEALAILASLRA
jgi:hypothetical protein